MNYLINIMIYRKGKVNFITIQITYSRVLKIKDYLFSSFKNKKSK